MIQISEPLQKELLQMIWNEWNICQIICIIFYPGSHMKQGTQTGIEYIVEMLNESIKPEQTTKVLLETMSGKGSEIGRTF